MSTIKSRIEDKVKRVDLYPEKEENKKKNQGGLLGGLGYIAGNIGTGIASVFENVGDAIGGTIADLSGNDRAAAYIYGRSTVGEWNQSLDEWYNPNKFMQGVGDVASGVGQSLTYAATAAIPVVGPKLSLGVIAASGFGGGVSSAYQQTGELGMKEYAYGALSGATELALEKFVGSTLSAGTRAAGKGASKGASLLGKSFTKSATRKGILKTTFTEASEEFLEEFASSYTDTLWLNVTGVDKGASTSLSDAFYNGMIGFFSGGLMSGASQGIRNGMNYSRGKRIMENGNAQTMFNTSKYISETLGLDELIQKGESDKEIRNNLSDKEVQLNNAMKAYDALENKTGAKAALYLGEMQETVAMMETQAKAFYNAETYKKTMKADPSEAERYAEIVSAVTGLKVSANDIKKNKPLIGDFGAMDTLGMIGVVGKYLNDKKTNYQARQADEALKESVVDLANVGTEAASETLTSVPTVQNAENVAENAIENAQISTEVQGVAESANVQTTEVETQNAGTVTHTPAEAEGTVKRSLSKTKVEKLKADIRNLGEKRITKDAGGKKITILTDKFSEKKNIFSKEGRIANEVNARIKNIPNLQKLIENSEYVGVDTDIRIDNEAKAGVSAIHKFKTQVSGYNVEILVRDKGKKQYLYEVKFIENKKSSQQSMTEKSASTAAQAVVENADIVAQEKSKVNTSVKKTSKKSSVKRDTSIDERVALLMKEGKTREEAERQVAKEEQKAKEKASTVKNKGTSQKALEEKQAQAKADEEAKAQAEAEQEAAETRNFEAYKKAELEAFKAIKGFNFLPGDVRYNITRMYMELADVKDVTKATKKEIASIMAVRPGLHIYASDRLADNGAYWLSRNGGTRVIVISKNAGAVNNVILHEVTHALATENSKEYRALSKMIRNHMVSRKEREKVRDAYMMRHLIDHDYILPGTSLADAKEVFKQISSKERSAIYEMVREELTARGVATALGNRNFLEKHGKEHRFAIMRAIAHLRRLGSDLMHRSEADKQIREIEKLFKAAAFDTEKQEKSFMRLLGEHENNERKKGSQTLRRSFVGKTEDGRSIYKTNYPPNTPKDVKQKDIIDLVQNVWSKKPIALTLVRDGKKEKIKVLFDPELSERSDLSKIAFGNTKGTASAKRITLNLSSDLYQIAEESQHTGSKIETGKDNPTHKDVSNWHYFATDLIYVEENGTEIECHMNIDVKEKENGNFFYSFGIEKGSRPTDVLSAVTDESATTSTNRISQNGEKVNTSGKISRSINVEEHIFTTHDERTKFQKGKDFVNTVRSRSARENAQAAWTSAELAAIKLQIITTNAQAGIEHQLMAAGLAQDVVESATNMARMGARKGEGAITSAQTDLKGNIVGDSFMKLLSPALPNRRDFSVYWVHKLNLSRAPRTKTAGFCL